MPDADAALLAPAKINLALHVTGRRDDGYHLLDSVAVFADFGDRVAIGPAEELHLAISGPFAAHAPGDASDLAFRAAQAFFARAGLPLVAAIRVEKNIPAGAGLGGGSSDAAAVLVGLDRFFQMRLPAAELREIGLRLGADVPMCLAGSALRARGVGETIVVIEGWPALPMVLVWPGSAVSTAAAFKSLARRENPPLPPLPKAGTAAELAEWLRNCRNDLEAPSLALAPAIGAVLEALRATPGCLIARMSGSGSACFGIYPDMTAARAAAKALAAAEPHWWVRATVAR